MKPPILRAVLLLAFLASLSLPRISAEISAGIAVANITPPVGGETMGYASAPPTDGVYDPLTVRVLVLGSAETSVAIVVWDLCTFNSPWLHARMPEFGIDQLLLLNTHTHAGPNLDQEEFPSLEEPIRSTVEGKVLEAIKEAKGNPFPAFFAAGEGSIPLGYNRLVRQPEGFAITHFGNPERVPYGPVDPTVGILRITDAEGAVRAAVVNYACHPVVLGNENAKLSADYPGVLREAIESQLGGDAVCFFIQGAAGDINPLPMARSEDREEDFPVVEAMGTLLVEEVVATLDRMKDLPGKSEQLLAASKLISVGHRWEPDETIRLGVTTLLLNSDIGIITMPGEPFHKFQVDWRAKSGLPHALFFGYCSNSGYPWPRYLPDIESAAYGGYGASDATLAEVGAGERLLNCGLAQLYQLQGRLRSEPQRHLND